MRPLYFVSISALLLGCSFDFGSFSQGGSSPSGASQSVSSANSGSAGATTGNASTTASGSGGATSTTASASSSTGAGGGGGSGPLAPCGLSSDTFDSLNLGTWAQIPTISNNGNKITATALGGHAGLVLLASDSYDECYASIKIVGTQSDPNGHVAIALTDLGLNALQGAYNEKHMPMAQLFAKPPGTAIDTSANVTHLGIAFHAATTRFLYGDAGGWHQFAQSARAAWQDDIIGDHISFGLEATDGSSAVFDDFNLRTISLSDLP